MAGDPTPSNGLTLDAGAFIALEKGDEGFRALWGKAIRLKQVITVPAVVVAQVWRRNSALTSMMLKACLVQTLDEAGAKAVGLLLARSRTVDVVDAAVVVGAARRGDAILTSDPSDIARLVAACGRRLRVLAV